MERAKGYETWTVDRRTRGREMGAVRDRSEVEREERHGGRECKNEIGKDGWLYTEEIYDGVRRRERERGTRRDWVLHPTNKPNE